MPRDKKNNQPAPAEQAFPKSGDKYRGQLEDLYYKQDSNESTPEDPEQET